jgi:hypothetical protein
MQPDILKVCPKDKEEINISKERDTAFIIAI